MAWDAQSAEALQSLAGAYSLPGDCWAVLTISPSPAKESGAEAYPEGYAYTWVILAPGQPPSLRGHRMAGLDNSDDRHVREQIKANPRQGMHRAHRHYPDWKEVVSVRGEDWPVADKGLQLAAPPASPQEFWKLCMDCLSDTFVALGLEMPNETQLFASHMTEKAFREMQRSLGAGPESGLDL